MGIEIDAVKALIKEDFRGNTSWFAEIIGIDRGYLSKILSGEVSNRSKKAIDGIISYCEKKGIDYHKYIIFFEESRA